PNNVSSAIRIATVEGRHSGYVNALQNQPLVPLSLAFETPMFQQEVLNVTAKYISSLNGGTNPGYNEGGADPHDHNNFKFMLYPQCLVSAFYNGNVPRFF